MDIKLRLRTAREDLLKIGHLTHSDTCLDALAEIEALEIDALRYRWLRNEAKWPASAECSVTAGALLDELCDSQRG